MNIPLSAHSLVIGGSNGIGLSVVLQLAQTCNHVTIVDKVAYDDTPPMFLSASRTFSALAIPSSMCSRFTEYIKNYMKCTTEK